MAKGFYYTCDECEIMQEAAAVSGYHASWYPLPAGWRTLDGKDICSTSCLQDFVGQIPEYPQCKAVAVRPLPAVKKRKYIRKK